MVLLPLPYQCHLCGVPTAGSSDSRRSVLLSCTTAGPWPWPLALAPLAKGPGPEPRIAWPRPRPLLSPRCPPGLQTAWAGWREMRDPFPPLGTLTGRRQATRVLGPSNAVGLDLNRDGPPASWLDSLPGGQGGSADRTIWGGKAARPARQARHASQALMQAGQAARLARRSLGPGNQASWQARQGGPGSQSSMAGRASLPSSQRRHRQAFEAVTT